MAEQAAEAAGGAPRAAVKLKEVLPTFGELFVTTDEPSVMCKPKIMPMKSQALQRMEEIQQDAQETLRQQDLDEQAKLDEAKAQEAAAAAAAASASTAAASAAADAAMASLSAAEDAVAAVTAAVTTTEAAGMVEDLRTRSAEETDTTSDSTELEPSAPPLDES